MWYSLTGAIVQIGQLYDGGMRAGDREATPAEVAAWQASQVSVPQTVSRAQLLLAAAGAGIITIAQAEALLASGVVPPNIAAAFATLPAASQAVATMAVLGESDYQRDDQFIALLGVSLNLTSAQIDALFVAAGGIAL